MNSDSLTTPFLAYILKICCWVFRVKALLLVNKKIHNLYDLKRLATQPATIHDSTHFERERIFDRCINYFPFRDMKIVKSKLSREIQSNLDKNTSTSKLWKCWAINTFSCFVSSSFSILSDWRAIRIIMIFSDCIKRRR